MRCLLMEKAKTEISTVHVLEGSAEVHSLNSSTLIITKTRFTSGARRFVSQDEQS